MTFGDTSIYSNGFVNPYMQQAYKDSKAQKGSGDDLEKTVATMSLGMFNVAVGHHSKSFTEKAWDSTSRQYKRSVAGKAAEHGTNMLLDKIGPPIKPPTGKPPVEVAPVTGAALKEATSRWDIAKTAHTKLNAWLDEKYLPETKAVLESKPSQVYTALSQNTWKNTQANFDYFSPRGLFNIGKSLASQYKMVDGKLELMDKAELGKMSLRQSFKNLSWANWKEAVRSNWADARVIPELPDAQKLLDAGKPAAAKLTFGNYMKFGVGGNWARGIGRFMSTGEGIFDAGISAAQIGFLAVNAFLTARKQWNISTQNRDGFFTKLLKTAWAPIKETAKTLFGYEVGALAFTAVYATVGIPFIGATLALASACTAGVLTSMAWKKVLGASTDEDPAEKQAHAQEK